ncbi:MAG: 3-deoxy-manno-octulosonate cytidylyltransferase [Acidobacteriota bacterium]
MTTHALGVIPARLGSTRLPGKPLREIGGKPMIAWVVERAREARLLDAVVVATDDDDIAACAREAGAEAVMTSPDHPSGTDRVWEVASARDEAIVVNVQGDEPLLEPAALDALVERLREQPDLALATLARPLRSAEEHADPSVVKVVVDDGGRALYFSRSPIPRDRNRPEQPPEGARVHVGVYAFRRDALERFCSRPPSRLEGIEGLEQLRALEAGEPIAVLDWEGTWQAVDTEADLARVESLLTSRGG